MTIYCARDFSVEDIQTIRDLIAQDQRLQRSALSRKLCLLWGWTKPNGELKDMTCRVALLRMQADGLPGSTVNNPLPSEFPMKSTL